MTTLRAFMGEYSIAKIDFLSRGLSGPFGVNYNHCRPLKPHGARMVKEGFFSLSRESRGGSARMTTLTITQKGRDELSRIMKRATRSAKKHGADTIPYLGSTVASFSISTPEEAKIRKERREFAQKFLER